MTGIPKPRKPGQTGGVGGHGRNMHNAQKRDQRRTDNDGCLSAVVIGAGLVASALSGVGYGLLAIIN